MKIPKVSILIPTFNQENYIRMSIESALKQDYENFEIIVSDDGSTDETKNILKEFYDIKKVTIIINRINIGRVANYRKLITSASGDWVINLDGDDYFTSEKYISNVMRLVQENQDIVLVFGRRYIDVNGILTKDHPTDRNIGLKTIMPGNDVFLSLPEAKIVINHLTCVYKRDLAISLDFYRYDITSSDWESLYRLIIGHKVGFLDQYCGAWRSHDLNVSRKFDERNILENYHICNSLYDFALKSHEFTKKELNLWLSSFVYKKMIDDCGLAIMNGTLSNVIRIIQRGGKISVMAAVKLFFTCKLYKKLIKRIIGKRANKQ